MLRRNPQTGLWERKEGEAWVPAHNTTESGTSVTELDVALDDAFSDTAPADDSTGGSGPARAVSGTVGTAGPTLAASTSPAPVEVPGSTGTLQVDLATLAENGAAGVPDSGQPGGVDGGAAGTAGNAPVGALSTGGELEVLDGDFTVVDDIPGLVSTEGPRSVTGQKSLRQRLQDRARGKKAAAATQAGAQGSRARGRGPLKVEVGPRAARPVGPAVKDSTAARTARRAQGKGEPAANARYVTKAAPELLEKRPKWVQDLFEAHFRSEITLAMRRTPSGPMRADGTYPNRMKISRQDYAIGWLTLFDKVREDASVLRLRDGNA